MFGTAAAFAVLYHFVNPAEKGFPAGLVNVEILFRGRYVGDDEHTGETGLPTEVAAREQERVAIQIVQYIWIKAQGGKILKYSLSGRMEKTSHALCLYLR